MAYSRNSRKIEKRTFKTEDEIRTLMQRTNQSAQSIAKKNNYDQRFCSGPVKHFTKEEIAQYEQQILPKK